MAKRRKAAGEHASELARLRALAHPLRFRIYQEFAGRRRTTRQVAAILDEPPTRLYHHVNLLERVGLLRMVETRPNRGTIEKYFEVARAMGRRVRSQPEEKPGTRRLQGAIGTMVFDEARLEMLAALEARRAARPGRRTKEAKDVTVVRTMIPGPAARIVRLRTAFLRLLKRHTLAEWKRRPDGTIEVPEDADTWSFTLAILPRPKRR